MMIQFLKITVNFTGMKFQIQESVSSEVQSSLSFMRDSED